MRNCSLGSTNTDDKLPSPVEDGLIHRVSHMQVLKPLSKQTLSLGLADLQLYSWKKWCEDFPSYPAKNIL